MTCERLQWLMRVRITPVYCSKMHATFKRNYQLVPGARWLELLLAHIPDKHEHLLRYYGFYSSRRRGERRKCLLESDDTLNAIPSLAVITEPGISRAARISWARLIKQVYEADPLRCRCGAPMRVIAPIDDPHVIRRILEHLGKWDPRPPGPGPPEPQAPWPPGSQIPLSYHPVPDIA